MGSKTIRMSEATRSAEPGFGVGLTGYLSEGVTIAAILLFWVAVAAVPYAVVTFLAGETLAGAALTALAATLAGVGVANALLYVLVRARVLAGAA